MKNKHIPTHLLQHLSEFITNNTGLYYPQENWDELEKKVIVLSNELKYDNPLDFVLWVMQTPSIDRIRLLAQHLTVGETYFFRDKHLFELIKKILVSLIAEKEKKNKNLRIWSAGCCTGEEPYSIAILLKELMPIIKDWTVTIIASDINPLFLAKAKKGEYPEWSFRETPNAIRERYFSKLSHKRYLLSHEIKKMVQFYEINLILDSYFPLVDQMDLIICSNVLLYFSPSQILKVVNSVTACLSVGGYFVVSPIEVPSIKHPQLKIQRAENTTYFKKEFINLSDDEKSVEIKEKNKKKHPISGNQSILVKLPEFINSSQPILEFDFKDTKSNGSLKKSFRSFSEQTEVMHPENEISKVELAKQAYNNKEYENILNLFDFEIKNNKQMKLEEIILIIKANLNLKRTKEAFAWCEKGIEDDKLNPYLYFLKAEILQELNRLPEAIEILKKAIFIDSDYILAYFVMGNLLLELKKPKESYKQFKNVLKLAKNFEKNFIIDENLTTEELTHLTHALMKNIEKSDKKG